uniref:Attacin_C domain-containing protein n=1 Tax=Globodera pallida TaxID=36090 RepID=A0A183C9T2_GLOPA
MQHFAKLPLVLLLLLLVSFVASVPLNEADAQRMKRQAGGGRAAGIININNPNAGGLHWTGASWVDGSGRIVNVNNGK